MKRLIGLFLLSCSAAFAAPTVVGDVSDGVTNCRVFLDNTEVATVTASSNLCSYDVGGVSNGTHRVEMTAIGNDPIWGGQESAKSVPLDFVRPAPATAPGGLRLQP